MIIAITVLCVSELLLSGCSRDRHAVTFPVMLAGHTFNVELAADPATIDRGLGGRSAVARDGGMLFIFNEASYQGFVMSDCPMSLDLIFLDQAATILTLHAMIPEPPRGADESAHNPDHNAAYLARLKIYSSSAPCSYALEVAGGTIHALGLRAGDRVVFDAAALAQMLSAR